jgi:flagella basal body P-ring formation protein FlgA
MRLLALFAVALCLIGQARADSLIAMRTLPAKTIITPEDVGLVASEIPGAMQEISPAIGKELRRAIYAGRAIMPADVAAPALVERNQIVALTYQGRAMTIRAEGRALTRGAEGDWIEVMNLSSKTKVTGRVAANGVILVGPSDGLANQMELE